jgi:predicted nucleic acid-binding Zn ribbon protein
VLKDVGSKLGFAAPAETGKVWARWAEIVGPAIERHAEPTSLRSGVLRIRADSPIWATEIRYLATEIQQRTNEVAGRDVVTEIRVWTGSGPWRRNPARVFQTGNEPRAEPEKGTPDDPSSAFSRAHEAWSKRRRKQARPAPATTPEKPEKPR